VSLRGDLIRVAERRGGFSPRLLYRVRSCVERCGGTDVACDRLTRGAAHRYWVTIIAAVMEAMRPSVLRRYIDPSALPPDPRRSSTSPSKR
jgi:hypothetical protein